MKRLDVHAPSAIVPADYQFVGHDHLKVESFGDAEVAMRQHEIIHAHMEHTGGKYSDHAHGGVCMVCGNANAIYTILFYHAATNSYVRVGHDCAEKIWSSDFGGNEFRKGIQRAIEAKAGKRKAEAILEEAGLTQAWEIASSFDMDRAKWEERTITDIVDKLVRYGSLSEKQMTFLGSLVEKINARVEDNAPDAEEGALTITGEIVKVKWQEGYYGGALKMLVKTVEGWRAWGTAPSTLGQDNVGETITFKATFTRSQDDPKFAFFKRPRLVS